MLKQKKIRKISERPYLQFQESLVSFQEIFANVRSERKLFLIS